MCRWLAYSGAPIYLEEIVLQPEHSLIDQSLAARVSESTTNGDGFGLGWYDSRDIPGVFRDVLPAWNDSNLKCLAHQIRSPLFLAHIRAATGSAVQRTNCHPFSHGKWLFVHNGLIHGFSSMRRELMLAVEPDLYSSILGTTDSELMFYLALTFGMQDDPFEGVARMVGFVEDVARSKGIEQPLQMTLGISDGECLYAFRYASSSPARSLYHSKSVEALRQLHPEFERFSADARAVVSEPLTDLTDYWVEVPEGTALAIGSGGIECRGFEPKAP